MIPVYVLLIMAVIFFIISGHLALKNRKGMNTVSVKTGRKITVVILFFLAVLFTIMTVGSFRSLAVPDKTGIKLLSTDIKTSDVQYTAGKKLGTTLADDDSFLSTQDDDVSIRYTDSIYNRKTVRRSDVINVIHDKDIPDGQIRIDSCLTKCRTGLFWRYAVKYVIYRPE